MKVLRSAQRRRQQDERGTGLGDGFRETSVVYDVVDLWSHTAWISRRDKTRQDETRQDKTRWTHIDINTRAESARNTLIDVWVRDD